MKIKSLFILVLVIFAMVANAQIKVTNQGNVGIGLSNNNPNAKLDVYGGSIKFNYNRYGDQNVGLFFRFWNADPRICSTNMNRNRVIFYNHENDTYNDIQVGTCFQVDQPLTRQTGEGDIMPINDGLNKILKLKGIKYHGKNGTKGIKKNGKACFIAEEVEQVIPEVVFSNDSNKVKGISYSGIIPYIVEAMKEQQKEIEQLKFEINSLKGNKGNNKSSSLSGNNNQSGLIQDNPILYQNMPNPFTNETKINYYLPYDTQKASLLIFNMQGTEIKNIKINQFENNSVSIKGCELKAGMYFYTLTANEKEIDTKKMILTK